MEYSSALLLIHNGIAIIVDISLNKKTIRIYEIKIFHDSYGFIF